MLGGTYTLPDYLSSQLKETCKVKQELDTVTIELKHFDEKSIEQFEQLKKALDIFCLARGTSADRNKTVQTETKFSFIPPSNLDAIDILYFNRIHAALLGANTIDFEATILRPLAERVAFLEEQEKKLNELELALKAEQENFEKQKKEFDLVSKDLAMQKQLRLEQEERIEKLREESNQAVEEKDELSKNANKTARALKIEKQKKGELAEEIEKLKLDIQRMEEKLKGKDTKILQLEREAIKLAQKEEPQTKSLTTPPLNIPKVDESSALKIKELEEALYAAQIEMQGTEIAKENLAKEKEILTREKESLSGERDELVKLNKTLKSDISSLREQLEEKQVDNATPTLFDELAKLDTLSQLPEQPLSKHPEQKEDMEQKLKALEEELRLLKEQAEEIELRGEALKEKERILKENDEELKKKEKELQRAAETLKMNESILQEKENAFKLSISEQEKILKLQRETFEKGLQEKIAKEEDELKRKEEKLKQEMLMREKEVDKREDAIGKKETLSEQKIAESERKLQQKRRQQEEDLLEREEALKKKEQEMSKRENAVGNREDEVGRIEALSEQRIKETEEKLKQKGREQEENMLDREKEILEKQMDFERKAKQIDESLNRKTDELQEAIFNHENVRLEQEKALQEKQRELEEQLLEHLKTNKQREEEFDKRMREQEDFFRRKEHELYEREQALRKKEAVSEEKNRSGKKKPEKEKRSEDAEHIMSSEDEISPTITTAFDTSSRDPSPSGRHRSRHDHRGRKRTKLHARENEKDSRKRNYERRIQKQNNIYQGPNAPESTSREGAMQKAAHLAGLTPEGVAGEIITIYIVNLLQLVFQTQYLIQKKQFKMAQAAGIAYEPHETTGLWPEVYPLDDQGQPNFQALPYKDGEAPVEAIIGNGLIPPPDIYRALGEQWKQYELQMWGTTHSTGRDIASDMRAMQRPK
ncbi:MAG: hypothetical protein BGO43_07995 [Gammaproteobacteria bacterium 39-13]|nr:hypothetical protein [Gammaproteobacteria bacterium]OJV93110.1 MAG: hypothetical protein BGO43_07995 [Gammaproteobacteria bacterium 39-13]